MSALGLTPDELALIRAVFRRHPEVESVQLFGSRAKGTHQPWSDVDLALRGVTDPLRAEAIAADLDELPLPYRFDVVAFPTIAHEPLREHIERVGVTVYRRVPRAESAVKDGWLPS